MIEDLLTDLADSGWSLSWAFQFAPDHWRVSIVKQIDDKIYFSHCADAPTFQDALEDAMCKRNDAECELLVPITYTLEQTKAQPLNLLKALGLVKPIDRRI